MKTKVYKCSSRTDARDLANLQYIETPQAVRMEETPERITLYNFKKVPLFIYTF